MRWKLRVSRRRLLGLTLTSLLALSVGVSYAETRTLLKTRLKAGIGTKIVFLTDPHIHSLGAVEEAVLEQVAYEEPDIILLGGDVVDELTRDMKSAERYVSQLDAREKFAVMGNHEYWSGLVGEMAGILKQNGFSILKDTRASSHAGSIYGLDWRESRVYPQLTAEGIVLVHDPNAAQNIRGRCLILAGHTHGGLVIAGQTIYSNSIYVRGEYKITQETTLYVSRGLGQMLPLRPTSPLELVIVE